MKNTKYSSLKSAGKLAGTIKAAVAKRVQRDNNIASPRPVKGMAATVLIPLGSGDRLAARVAAEASNKRRKNWESAEADRSSVTPDVRTNDCGRYSSRCTYTHYTYTPTLRSCGRQTKSRLVAFVGRECYRIRAAKGWEFGCDEYGMFAVRSSRSTVVNYRYHFTSEDVRSHRQLFLAARNHEAEQLEQKRADRSRKAESILRAKIRAKLLADGSVWVKFTDARAAGNCAAGIRQFCGQNGLSVTKCYPLKAIQRLAAIDNRVQRTIDAAVDRAVTDEIRGFCVVK